MPFTLLPHFIFWNARSLYRELVILKPRCFHILLFARVCEMWLTLNLPPFQTFTSYRMDRKMFHLQAPLTFPLASHGALLTTNAQRVKCLYTHTYTTLGSPDSMPLPMLPSSSHSREAGANVRSCHILPIIYIIYKERKDKGVLVICCSFLALKTWKSGFYGQEMQNLVKFLPGKSTGNTIRFFESRELYLTWLWAMTPSILT